MAGLPTKVTCQQDLWPCQGSALWQSQGLARLIQAKTRHGP